MKSQVLCPFRLESQLHSVKEVAIGDDSFPSLSAFNHGSLVTYYERAICIGESDWHSSVCQNCANQQVAEHPCVELISELEGR